MLRNDFTFYIVIIQLTEQQRQQLQSMDPQQRSIFIQKLQRDREAQLRAQQQQKLMAQRQQMMAQQQSQQQQQQQQQQMQGQFVTQQGNHINNEAYFGQTRISAQFGNFESDLIFVIFPPQMYYCVQFSST